MFNGFAVSHPEDGPWFLRGVTILDDLSPSGYREVDVLLGKARMDWKGIHMDIMGGQLPTMAISMDSFNWGFWNFIETSHGI